MEDTRKGVLTPAQEKQADYLYKGTGISEAVDGIAISIIDNQLIERLKVKIIEKYPDALPIVYDIVDAIFLALPNEEAE